MKFKIIASIALIAIGSNIYCEDDKKSIQEGAVNLLIKIDKLMLEDKKPETFSTFVEGSLHHQAKLYYAAPQNQIHRLGVLSEYDNENDIFNIAISNIYEPNAPITTFKIKNTLEGLLSLCECENVFKSNMTPGMFSNDNISPNQALQQFIKCIKSDPTIQKID